MKARERLLLLQLEVDSQHLRVKELESLSQALTHRELESADSRAFHLSPAPVVLEQPLTPEAQREHLRNLLGM